MQELVSIQNLLQTVLQISNKYDEIAKVTGERYNIFQILKVQNDELSHSAFLGDLLSRKGRHGLDDKFLKIFINLFREKFNEGNSAKQVLEVFHTANCKVKIEQNVDNKSEKEEGGRMDIVIADDMQRRIIIENKIYALDQPLQLVRYHHYDKSAPIIYLTLYGTEPVETSTKGNLNGIDYDLKNKDKFVCISYSEDIIEWLELCLKETINLPLLRETIKQYIYLIKLLTQQSTNVNMKNEIISFISKDSNNIKAAFEIGNAFEKLKYKLMEDFAIAIREKLQNSIYGNIDYSYQPFIGKQWTFFQFKSKGNTAIFIHLQFQENFGKVKLNVVSTDRSLAKSLNEKHKLELKNVNIGAILKPEVFYQWGIIWSSQFDALTNFFNKEQYQAWCDIANGDLDIIDIIFNVVNDIIEKVTISQPTPTNV